MLHKAGDEYVGDYSKKSAATQMSETRASQLTGIGEPLPARNGLTLYSSLQKRLLVWSQLKPSVVLNHCSTEGAAC